MENIPHYFIIRQNMPVHHSREVTVLKRKLKALATQHKLKLIQPLGKLIYTNRWEIRKNIPSSLAFFIFVIHQ